MKHGRHITPHSHTNRRGSTRCEVAHSKRSRRRRKLRVVHKHAGDYGQFAIMRREKNIMLLEAPKHTPEDTADDSSGEHPAKTFAGAIIGDLDVFLRRMLKLSNDVQGSPCPSRA
jgi:hypothetical protein